MTPFDSIHGYLPDGLHRMTLAEVGAVFTWTPRRTWLHMGLSRAAAALRVAGCRTIILDGSFVTSKANPGDYDAAFDPLGVDGDLLDPVLLRHTDGRRAMKAKYLGDIFPWGATACSKTGSTFRDFFRTDRSGVPKGMVEIRLDMEP
jgi:hypothetical protein